MYNETVLLGVLISLLFTEVTGLSAGLVIPGYLALCLHSPLRILSTLAVAAAAVGLCRLLSRWTILYGRRRFALLLVLAFALSLLADYLGLLPGGADVIGIVIPGLIARELDRQGFADTLLSLAVTTGAVAAVLFLLGRAPAGL